MLLSYHLQTTSHCQEATIVTPKMFMHGLTKRCKADPQHIMLPESLDKRVLKAAEDVTRRGIARITLLGNPVHVAAQAKLLNVDISGCEVVDHMNSPAFDRYVAAVCEARKSKNWTPEQVGGGVDAVGQRVDRPPPGS